MKGGASGSVGGMWCMWGGVVSRAFEFECRARLCVYSV
jgi:hypothetical protein